MAGLIGCMNAHRMVRGKDCGQCTRPVAARGLCMGCYEVISKLVRAGETTWAEQENRGCCLPVVKRNSWKRWSI